MSVNKGIHEIEIDIVDLLKTIWSKKWFIFKVTSVFVLFGLVIAFTSPKEYETSCTLIPEASGEEGKLGGSLGGLASLAGVDFGGLTREGQSINPALYKSVSQSTPFLMEFINHECYFQEIDQSLSIYSYYLEYYKIGFLDKLISLPFTFIGFVKSFLSTEPAIYQHEVFGLVITEEEKSIMDNLKERIFVEMDWELNVLNISVEMQDPMVAAQMALFTKDYITAYVTDYALSKNKQQLSSIEDQYNARKAEFESAQSRLAIFRDRNQNVTTAMAKSEIDRLQSEYNLAFNVYNQLAQQREVIRLKLEEDTPVFTVLEPVKVPVEKSKPKRSLILVLSSILGCFIAGLWVIIVALTKDQSIEKS